MASEISQYGITWRFDRDYPVGQFITGDWWVVGPVVVREVTPAPGLAPADETINIRRNRWGDSIEGVWSRGRVGIRFRAGSIKAQAAASAAVS